MEKAPKGVVGMVLGIISTAFSWIPLLGLIISIIANVISKKQHKISPNDFTRAGMTISSIGFILSIVFLVIEIIVAIILFAIFA